MRKFEIDHLKNRVKEVVSCTNGQVSTKLNKSKKLTGLTDTRKISMIRQGVAILKSDHELSNETAGYNNRLAIELVRCFTYPVTEKQQEKIAFNKTIDAKIDSIHTEIELEGKRIIDKALLGIIQATEIPNELYRLGEMSKLAN